MIDFDKFRISGHKNLPATETPSTTTVRNTWNRKKILGPGNVPIPDGLFLRGPIPLYWLQKAANLPGRALHVGILAWLQAYLGGRMTIYIQTKFRDRFGVSRHAEARALRVLKEAGLITLEQKRGRRPMITILDVTDSSE